MVQLTLFCQYLRSSLYCYSLFIFTLPFVYPSFCFSSILELIIIKCYFYPGVSLFDVFFIYMLWRQVCLCIGLEEKPWSVAIECNSETIKSYILDPYSPALLMENNKQCPLSQMLLNTYHITYTGVKGMEFSLSFKGVINVLCSSEAWITRLQFAARHIDCPLFTCHTQVCTLWSRTLISVQLVVKTLSSEVM